MGLMELPRTEPGQLIVTPHPMLLDGQRTVVWEARAGESLYALLMRNVPELDGQPWAVSIGGVVVERHLWHCVYPKQGQVVEVRGGVGKTALMVVAMIALTYFTMGAGAGWISGAFGVAAGGMGATLIGAGLFIAGSMLVNKVLGPKPAKMGSQSQDSVYSLSGARNQLRQYEPLPMLFGKVRITPDLLSKPYTWYEGNDQYLGLQLCAGINVGRVEEIYNGDTLLSSYEGAKVYHAGYSQMPDQAIPLYSNADVIDGGQLLDTSSDPKHTPSAWIERTSSADTVRLIVGLEFQLYDKTSKGKDKNNTERVEIQYRPTGTTGWLSFGNYTLNSSQTKAHRAGYGKDVARGQYDVRVRTAGLNTDGSGAQAAFTWTTLTSVQVDESDYTGISRTGLELKATGQLNGTPDELRAIGYADPIPVWDGSAWTTEETSNPGAQILSYARGISRGGRLLGGMALDEDQIDVESLKAFTLHCAANGYAYNFYIKDARNHEQVLSAIALAGFGQITWAGGRLGVVWAAQDQPLSGVVNMGTIKKGQFQVDYSLSNAADGIEYTYIDEATWETKTLRVPAPGVTTMLNPAQVTGEGVTTEEHAARMARWHLAQSLYQYKDISYSTDIEHLSYQRLSVLAMQHDMTQWGYGGRVVAAAEVAGVMTLQLDEPVPAPPSGVGYIGLRIPGERVYRVLKVKPFTGESDTIDLLDPWPSDAAVPGATPNNPAHDTLWIYDFKQTPGLRVRVVSVEPESDLKGASVRVVQEGAEFWNYVLTGDYVPSPSGSLLQTRPVASNLRVTEQQVVQGNTTFTELTATFDVSGPVSNVVVRAAVDGQELEEVAQTQTRMATWRIPSAGAYNIVVRPFSPDGEPGVAVSAAYVTVGAELPPKLVDLFDVEQRSGGVRIYTWGWLAETIQSPDFAGVEIRYIAGSVSSPIWDEMTPVGDTGYHTAPFEVVVPEAGTWTFSCRSRNSNGVLSTDARTVTRALTANLGEQIGDITEEQAAQQRKIDQEIEARVQGDLENATAVADEATARAAAIATEQMDRASAIIAEQTARAAAIAAEATARSNAINASAAASAENLLNAQLALEAKITNEATLRQTADTSLASQIATISAGTGEQFDTGGGIWYFDTTAEGWTAVSGSGTTIVDGWLRPDFSANATQNVQSPLLTFDSTSYRYVKFRLRKVGNPGMWRGWVRWITAADPTYDTAKQVSIPEPTFDANGIATVDFKDIPWPAGVTRVRIYPYSGMTSAGNYVEYDWIALGRPSPGASAAALQEERTARISGDAAEATQRTTLATQVRGNYTGTDPAQLQSGLLYQERQVRIAAEGVIATDVSSLKARMPAGNGKVATEASVTAEASARASGDEANASRTSAIESLLPAGGGTLATAAAVDAVQANVNTVDGKVTANTDSIQRLTAAVGSALTLFNASFELDSGWTDFPSSDQDTIPSGYSFVTTDPHSGARHLRINGGGQGAIYNRSKLTVAVGDDVDVSFWCGSIGSTPDGYVRLSISWRKADGTSNGAVATTAQQNTSVARWTKVVGKLPQPPAGTAYGILYIQTNHTVGAWAVDDVQVSKVGDTAAATAQSLAALSNTVTQQGQDISAVSTRLGTVEARVPSGTGVLATGAAVDAVQASVALVDGKVTANADSISKLSAEIGNVIAVQNPSFETVAGDIGWGTDILGSNNTLPAATTFTDSYAAQGKYSVRMSGGPDAPNRIMYNAQQFSLQGVKRIWLSLDSRTAGAPPEGTQVRIGLRYYDANGAQIANSYIPWFTATGGTWQWGQNIVSGWHTPLAGAASARVILYVQGLTAGVLLLDDVQVNLETATGAAIAQTLATVSNTVTQQGQDIAATSVRLGTVEARLPAGSGALATVASVTEVDSASVSRDEALGTRTGTIEARLPPGSDKLANEARVVAAESAAATATGAVATQLTQVKATAEGANASITNLMEVSATTNSIGLVDGGFEGSKGWGSSSTVDQPSYNLPSTAQYWADTYRSGLRSLRFNPGIASAASVFNNSWLRVKTGQKVRVTYWARTTGSVPTSAGYIRVSARTFRTDGTNPYVAVGASSPVTALSSTWQKLTEVYTVPAGVTIMQFAMQCLNNNANTAVYVDDVSAELIGEEGEIARAKVTNVLDVDGNISGTVSENDGVRSSYSILASVFRVVSKLTGMGMEWLDGYLRIWKGSAQLVLGHSFGSGDLVMWYGPNVGAANCTKSNGLFHLDTSGGGYFGGSLSAGTLKNAVQTTTTVTTGTELINGPFDTNGNTRSVVLSFSRTMAYVSNAYGTSGFTAGAGENTATIRLYRKIGSAAETLWQTLNAAGMVDIFNEGDAPDRANSRWGGALTVNDTSPAGQQVTYRAVITGYTSQSVSHPGTINSINTTQNLAIIATEQ
ncbi:host specificity factor TipJ family phage tail protein [Stenotrophomonas sp.]|uniref:host specificity factor TipJ family phage tail protein n=1 Tax=Stenotrophomonas sp. TaxID=69392 RepID=UPI002898A47A|nr:host specificity factor TipJ family phage tail protein [Stenotrophomonas sp.]